jgi:hypothetical protein
VFDAGVGDRGMGVGPGLAVIHPDHGFSVQPGFNPLHLFGSNEVL